MARRPVYRQGFSRQEAADVPVQVVELGGGETHVEPPGRVHKGQIKHMATPGNRQAGPLVGEKPGIERSGAVVENAQALARLVPGFPRETVEQVIIRGLEPMGMLVVADGAAHDPALRMARCSLQERGQPVSRQDHVVVQEGRIAAGQNLPAVREANSWPPERPRSPAG